MDQNRLDTLTKAFGTRSVSRRQALVLGGTGALIASGLSTGIHAQSATPRNMANDFAGHVDIGGRALYVESAGDGSPTVVLEAGLLGRSDVWSRDQHFPPGEREMVFPAVAEFTHVVAYDRPGTIGEVNSSLDPSAPLFYPSRSDPVPQPRTIADAAEDLNAMLLAAAVPPPYVLVGHSMGGMIVRLFANLRPENVVGMVLVDATTENINVEFERALPPAVWAGFDAFSAAVNEELLAAYPDYERLKQGPLLEDPSYSILRDAQIANPLQPMPLVVLSHGIPFPAPLPEWPIETMEDVMAAQQAWLATIVPDARHIIASKSGHNIHQDQPELVIQAIRDVVDAVRDPSTWTPATPVANASTPS
jgi:pimeloyl-ACP methyl ester carboxylesterase